MILDSALKTRILASRFFTSHEVLFREVGESVRVSVRGQEVTAIAIRQKASHRLFSLGLEAEGLQRALLRADAEARLISDLEPPNAEGVTRYNKTNRFLREELLPSGWHPDNTQGYCRTVHPGREWAIVASSGDGDAGIWMPNRSPSTKYRKGETTEKAVTQNFSQLSFDLGEPFQFAAQDDDDTQVVWYLLYNVTEDNIFVELSLPDAIEGGRITHWAERIIFDPIGRASSGSLPIEETPDDGNGDYMVDVAML